MKILKSRNLKNVMGGGFIIPWRQELMRALYKKKNRKERERKEEGRLWCDLSRKEPCGSEFLGRA